ncbi:MAG: hypothetical protein AAF449_18260 [Myxococcota bacterium]
MTDDKLRQLGDMARSDQAIPDVWRRVAEGSATATELAELEAQAAVDPQIARLLAQFRPLSPPEEDALVQRVSNHRRRKQRRTFVVSMALAAAAATAAIMLRPSSALPGYRLSANEADRPYRGGASSADVQLPVHHVDSALVLSLRPQRSVSGSVSIDTYRIDDGRPVPVAARWAIAKSGAARLDVRVKELFATPGRVRLIVVVRNEDRSPLTPKELVSNGDRLDATRADVRRMTYDFMVRTEPFP